MRNLTLVIYTYMGFLRIMCLKNAVSEFQYPEQMRSRHVCAVYQKLKMHN